MQLLLAKYTKQRHTWLQICNKATTKDSTTPQSNQCNLMNILNKSINAICVAIGITFYVQNVHRLTVYKL